MGKRAREYDEAPADSGSAIAAGLISISIGSESLTKVPATSESDPTATQAPAAKITELDPSIMNTTKTNNSMHCSLPPHKEPLPFSSYEEYESHYRNEHTNRCLECRKNFPSAHLLSLHISENHDAFIQVKRDKGERTYTCFVETCDKVCMTPQKRQMHLIAKHMYPKNFFFGVTRYGIDGRRSLLLDEKKKSGNKKTETNGRPSHQDRRPSLASVSSEPKEPQQQSRDSTPPVITAKPVSAIAKPEDDKMQIEPASPERKPDVDMDDISAAMSALQFVPRGVRFGRGKKAGFAKR